MAIFFIDTSLRERSAILSASIDLLTASIDLLNGDNAGLFPIEPRSRTGIRLRLWVAA